MPSFLSLLKIYLKKKLKKKFFLNGGRVWSLLGSRNIYNLYNDSVILIDLTFILNPFSQPPGLCPRRIDQPYIELP